MKKLISFVFIMTLFCQAQVYKGGVFDYSTGLSPNRYFALDTLGAADDSLNSREVRWSGFSSIKGRATIYGDMYLLTGDARTITVKLRQLFADSSTYYGDKGTIRTLGTVSVADSAKFEYYLPAFSWFKNAQGYELYFVPDATGSQVKIRCEQLTN